VRERTAAWLLVPRPGSPEVDVHRPRGFRDVRVDATWQLAPRGYRVRAVVSLASLGLTPGAAFRLDLLVNESGAGRERRRGQLVLSGGAGEFVYLRGDRQPPERLLPLAIVDV
jgi:hypothetical protein